MTPLRVTAAILAVLVMGCAMPAPPSSSASPGEPSAPGSAPGSPPAPTTSTVPDGEPPSAALLVPNGDPVIGQLGSYTWGQAGSDAPWLPGTIATADGSRSLRFGLSFDVPVAEWRARYATPGDVAPARPVALAVGALPLEVAAPPVGSWTVALTVVFAGGRGDATYYWRVEIP